MADEFHRPMLRRSPLAPPDRLTAPVSNVTAYGFVHTRT